MSDSPGQICISKVQEVCNWS